jgi:hypothetical protein
MNQYKKYLLLFLSFVSVILLLVAGVSYTYDPANIYRDATVAASPAEYVEQLLKSENGLLWPNGSWNERDIKYALAQDIPEVDCIIMGSSRVMQISSFREQKSLQNNCKTLVNLGVSSATLEDFLALSYVLDKSKVKKIIFGIDPWTLDFGRNYRWDRYASSYYAMSRVLSPESTDKTNIFESKKRYFLNLINPEYFLRAIKMVGQPKSDIQPAPFFDQAIGMPSPVILPDGSFIPSKGSVESSRGSQVPIGGAGYNILRKEKQTAEEAVVLFKALIQSLKKNDINIALLMTPYHPNVLKDQQSITTKALFELGSVVTGIGLDLSVNVLGSYDAMHIGCSSREFFDEIHAKPLCLSRLE